LAGQRRSSTLVGNPGSDFSLLRHLQGVMDLNVKATLNALELDLP
jgi:hypothetical protein